MTLQSTLHTSLSLSLSAARQKALDSGGDINKFFLYFILFFLFVLVDLVNARLNQLRVFIRVVYGGGAAYSAPYSCVTLYYIRRVFVVVSL